MLRLSATCLAGVMLIGHVALADHHEKDEQGFVSIFDGKSLSSWDGDPRFWSVRDGALTGETTKENPTEGNTFLIWRGGTLEDFELRLKFRIVGHNSGIQYRSKEIGDWVVAGYQADFEAGDTYTGILYDERGRGILAERGQFTHVVADGEEHKVNLIGSLGDSKEINSVIRKEDWNEYRIIAHSNRMVHIINGRVTCIVIDDDEAHADRSGILAFQLHRGPPMTVQFKDIRVRSY